MKTRQETQMKLSEKRGALSATGVGSTLLHMSMLTNILAKLRAHQSTLRDSGVLHVAVFGSVVRAENRDHSDVDLLVDLSPAVATDFFAYAGIAADLEAIVGQDVDVARRDRLRAHVRPSAERDAVYAF